MMDVNFLQRYQSFRVLDFVIYLTVAAEWKAMVTVAVMTCLSVSLRPRLGWVTSPDTGFILLKYSGVFSRILSNT